MGEEKHVTFSVPFDGLKENMCVRGPLPRQRSSYWYKTNQKMGSKLKKWWSIPMGWPRLAGSLGLQVSFEKEPYKRDDFLQKRLMILRSPLIIATPYSLFMSRTIYSASPSHVEFLTLLQNIACFIGLFCKRTHNFKEPPNRSHPIVCRARLFCISFTCRVSVSQKVYT